MEANNYELMLVATVDHADQLLSRVEKSLKDADASSVNVERLGKKTLAYSIRKQKDATYFVISFEVASEAIKPVSDKLRLEQEDLLRYMLLKKEYKKKKDRKGRVPEVSKVAEVSDVSQEDKQIPKVTVAVKKVSKVKSEKEKDSKSTKGTGSIKSTKSKKGKKK